MATDPPPSPPPEPRTGLNWPWVIVLALLAILLIFWLLNPSGTSDDALVADPIVVPDSTLEGAGPTGEALIREADAPVLDPDAPGADTGAELGADRLPIERPERTVPAQ